MKTASTTSSDSNTVFLFRESFATAVALLLNLQWGLCQGYTTMLLPQLNATDSAVGIKNEVEESWVGSIFYLANLPGAFIVGILMNISGRRTALRIAFLALLLGWVVIYVAESLTMVIIGQMISGIGAGMESVASVYIAETSTPKSRATKLTLTTAAINTGVLASNLLAYVLCWHKAALVLAAFAALSAGLTLLIHESPEWLVSQNRINAANDSLRWFGQQLKYTESGTPNLENGEHTRQTASKREYILKAWKPFCILQIFFILQLFSGYTVVVTYTVGIFTQIGSPFSETTSTMVYSAILLAFSAIFTAAINRRGRRVWCMLSGGGLCVSYFVTAVYLCWFQGVLTTWIPAIGLWASIAFGMLGINSLPWLVSSEILPLPARGFMTVLLYVTVYTYTFLLNKFYPILLPIIQIQGFLAIFSVTAFAAVFFGKYVLPETRGKSLAEIEGLWGYEIRPET